MSNEKIRAEFEEWLMEVHGLDSEWQPERNCFKDYAAHLAFQAWQESRESIEIELPTAKSHRNNEVVKAVGRHIIAQGMKVKP